MRIGVGRLGLRPDEFWGLTFPEFHLMLEENVEQRRERRLERGMAVIGIGMAVGGGKETTTNDIFRVVTGEDMPGREVVTEDDDLEEQLEIHREQDAALKAKMETH